ncbi:MAG: ImmA/IrrE family metallo-endopeptidase [Verrucomicrobiae bacterium]|nr:ImmA/IrrE family metallo-endopeptidase [Verrucomicrobiae bacterium]
MRSVDEIEDEARDVLLNAFRVRFGDVKVSFEEKLQFLKNACAQVADLENLLVLDVPHSHLQSEGYSGGSHDWLGLIDLTSDRILLNADQRERNQGRYRFTFAHELGHWFLHRNHSGGLFREYLSGKKNSVEKEADIFASFFLMPTKLVVQAFHLRFGGCDDFGRFMQIPQIVGGNEGRIYQDLSDERKALLCAKSTTNKFDRESLARMFQVSDTAMARRLFGLGLF